MRDTGQVPPTPAKVILRHVVPSAVSILGVFIAVFLSAARPAAAQGASPVSPLVGHIAPDFTLRGLAGRNVRLSDHRGEVVLLGFWTSWCGGCRAELEQISRLSDTYHSAGLAVIGISLDDDRTKAGAFSAAHGGNVINVFDGAKVTGRSYQIADVPLIMLVDRNGVVRFAHGEYSRRDEQDLVQQVRLLLDE